MVESDIHVVMMPARYTGASFGYVAEREAAEDEGEEGTQGAAAEGQGEAGR